MKTRIRLDYEHADNSREDDGERATSEVREQEANVEERDFHG